MQTEFTTLQDAMEYFSKQGDAVFPWCGCADRIVLLHARRGGSSEITWTLTQDKQALTLAGHPGENRTNAAAI